MRILSFLWVIVIHLSANANAQLQRALIIGIDHYSPPATARISTSSGRSEWPNLDGCKNDALAIKDEIVLRWGFKNENILELYDSMASRKNILQKINDLLVASNKGDIVFIYYAGHGSQVKNSKSNEADKLDESIVPSDVWKEGVDDIRDKTLASLVNKFIDKGVLLTTIYDCCHSGSLGRGFNNDPPKFRYLKASNLDAMDASNPLIPELRSEGKYLIISASQDNEPAQEQHDDNNIPHGAFTVALLKAMNQQSVDASINNLFSATRAILKGNGKKQEPVLGGSSSRLHGTLFGLKVGALPDKTLIPLISIVDSTLEFQGGLMAGINIDNELTRANGNVKVKIVSMLGANRCSGKIISGKIEMVYPGQLFELSNWVSSTAAFLKVFIPESSLSFSQVEKVKLFCMEAKKLISDKWVDDIEKHDADINFYFNGKMWSANDAKNGTTIIPEMSSTSIKNFSNGRYVHVNIPPSQSLYNELRKKLSLIRTIQLTNDPNDAQYFLAGNINDDNQLSYGWVRSQSSAADSLEAMPVRTRFFNVPDETITNLNRITDSLYAYSIKISKIRAWLNLQAPQANNQFPFHLDIRSVTNHSALNDAGVAVGDKLTIYLKGGDNYLNKWDRKKRFVYVFLIDKNGSMNLIYPDENSGNVNNRFPVLDEQDQPVAEQKLVEGEVTEPVGTDSYFLLATEEPVQDYSYVFNQDGVRGNRPKNNDPLNNLLDLANPSFRGLRKPITINWNLERIQVKTRH